MKLNGSATCARLLFASVAAASLAFMAAASAAAADPITIPSGGTGRITLGGASWQHIGEPGCTSTPGFTVHISPRSVSIIGGVPTGPEATLTLQVPASLSPGRTIILSWSSNDAKCNSSSGSVTIKVGRAGSGSGGSGSQRGSSMQDCGTVLVETHSVRVYVQDSEGKTMFSQACAEAHAVAQGQSIAGVTCWSPAGFKRVERYLLCTKRKTITVITPTRTAAGQTGCNPVTYQGRRYLVYKQRVLCTYARATALRMLRRETPYIYEFESALQGRRWKCRILGRETTERGSCYKQVEDRWVLYFPAPR